MSENKKLNPPGRRMGRKQKSAAAGTVLGSTSAADRFKEKDMSGAAVSEGELERFEKIIPSVENKMGGGMMEDPMGYKTGGAIEVGKGKDYIKDLL